MGDVTDSYLIAVLIALVALAVAIVLVHLAAARTRKPTSAEPQETIVRYAGRAARQYSLGELCEIRFGQGLGESVLYVRAFQEACVMELASEDVSEEREAWLRTTLDTLGRYRKLSEEEQLANRHAEWACLTRELKKECVGRKEVPPVYEILDAIRAALVSKDFDLVISTLSKFKGKVITRGSSEYERSLLKPLREVTEAAGRLEVVSQEDRTRRGEVCADVVNVLGRAVQSTIPGKTNKMLMEVGDLSDSLCKVHEMAKARHLQLVDKPVFEVQYRGNREKLPVAGGSLTLEFRVVNKSQMMSGTGEKSQIVPHVDVEMKPSTTQLGYTGSTRRVEMEVGEAMLSYTLDSFLLDAEGAREQARLRFVIEYSFMGQRVRQESEVMLPPFEVVERIVNPFEESRGGGGLPGNSSLFVGRKELLNKIASGLLRANTEPVFHLLAGLPRSGKTSVLKQLAENEFWLKGKVEPIWVVRHPDGTLGEFYKAIYDLMRAAMELRLGRHQVVLQKSSGGAANVCKLLSDNTLAMRQARMRLLLLVDEYQRLRDWDASLGAPADSIAEFLKTLRDHHGDIVSVTMAGLYALDDKYFLTREQWCTVLGGRFETVGISNLAKSEAEELLLRPFARHGIKIDAACLDRAWGYTRGHPFLHVLIGYHTFRRLVTTETSYREGKTVRLLDIDEAARSIDGADMKFIWSEKQITDVMSARLFLAAIAQRTALCQRESGDPTDCPWCTVYEVRQFLETECRHGVASYDFEGEIGVLRDRKLLEVDHGKPTRYRLVYPLFAQYCDATNQVASLLGLMLRNEGAKGDGRAQ